MIDMQMALRLWDKCFLAVLESHIGSWLALEPTLRLRSFGTEWRRAPWFMKRSSWYKQLGWALPLESATSRSPGSHARCFCTCTGALTARAPRTEAGIKRTRPQG